MSDHPSVFISCSRDDVQRASQISEALKRNGTPAVTDWTNLNGGDWIATLESTLDDCGVFVPLVSKAFLSSEFARYEVGFATHKQATGSIRIIPVILDEVDEVPLPGPLRRFPALDGRGKQSHEIAHAALAALTRESDRIVAGHGNHALAVAEPDSTLTGGNTRNYPSR